MKWFQHQCDADENKKVRKIEKWGLSRGGEDGAMAATGRYWRLLEKLGKAEEKNGKFAFEPGYDLDLVADDLRCSLEYLVEFCNLLAQISAIDPQLWQENQEIACPKLAERCDEYCKKKARRKQKVTEQPPEKVPTESPPPLDNVPTVSGQSPQHVPTESSQSPEKVPPVSGQSPDNGPTESGAACKNQHLHLQKKPDSTSVLSSADADAAPPPPRITPSKVFCLWNDLGCKPSLAELSTERLKRLTVRVRKRGDPDWWERLFNKVKVLNKPWLTFDFLIANDTNALKVLEGNYDRDFGSKNSGGRGKTGPGGYPEPNPENPGKFAAITRTLSTDPGGAGAGLEASPPGQGGVSDPPGGPPG
jgi:hypothetical protein